MLRVYVKAQSSLQIFVKHLKFANHSKALPGVRALAFCMSPLAEVIALANCKKVLPEVTALATYMQVFRCLRLRIFAISPLKLDMQLPLRRLRHCLQLGAKGISRISHHSVLM